MIFWVKHNLLGEMLVDETHFSVAIEWLAIMTDILNSPCGIATNWMPQDFPGD